MIISDQTFSFFENPQATPVDYSITINPKHVIRKVADEDVFNVKKNIN